MRTVARKTAGRIWLNGPKMWISNAPIADVFVVWAKSEAHGGKGSGLCAGKRHEGGFRAQDRGQTPLRASITGEIVMENVEVPEDALLLPRGMGGPLAVWNRARYGISWGAMGAAEDCWFRARQYGLDRHQFNRRWPRPSFTRRNWPICRPEIALGLQASLRVGRLMDEAVAPEMISSSSATIAARRWISPVRPATCMAATASRSAYHVMRHAEPETVNTYEGTHDVHAAGVDPWPMPRPGFRRSIGWANRLEGAGWSSNWRILAGPGSTETLADLGAEVIKIGGPGRATTPCRPLSSARARRTTEPSPPCFHAANRGKRSGHLRFQRSRRS